MIQFAIITTDLMSFIESSFSVAKGRENTAITGFSMGGRESLFIGFERPDLFGYIGSVCPAPGLVKIANSPMHPGQMTDPRSIYLLLRKAKTEYINCRNKCKRVMVCAP